MRQRLANVILASTTLSGCSFIFNPNDLPSIDAPPAPPDQAIDAPDAFVQPDADPSMLTLTSAAPALLVEGQGVGGSRPAVLVLEGANFVPTNTTVTLTAASGDPMLVVDNANLQVSADHTLLAVPVSLPIDEAASDTIPLIVTVTHDGPSGSVTRMLENAVSLRRLPELKTGNALLASGFPGGTIHEFSVIDVAAAVTIRGAAAAGDPIRIRATSSVSITQATIDVDANGQTAGAGGFGGGTGGNLTSATVGGGQAGGAVSAGNGGWSGDAGRQLTTMAAPNRSSGGGGSTGLAGLLGGAGGGGGGAIELSAAGDMTIPGVLARGAAGVAGVGGAGGHGSGGVIWVRAGGALTISGALDASSRGGGGTQGAARFDAAGTLTGTPGGYRGPAFADAPLIATTEAPSITMTGKALEQLRYFVIGAMVSNVVERMPAQESETFALGVPLQRGFNELCAVVKEATTASDTRTCIQVAYLPQ